MTKRFDSFRLTFARTRRCLQVLALGFHAVNDVLDPVLEQFRRRRRLIRGRCLRSLIAPSSSAASLETEGQRLVYISC